MSVEATKPPSSRNVSAEIFVVCRGFKAPKRIDPRFLDPRSVFAELSDPTPNNEAKVFNPEVKKRKREGYEEGDYTQFKEVTASEFIQTTDPIAILGGMNRLSFKQPPNGDVALAALDKLPETTDEIRSCCEDLRVLGRKEFRNLLRWRLKVRERFGFATKKSAKEDVAEEITEIEPMDEELKIQEELQALSEKERARRKRERRRENEKKQKEIVRMQLHMVTPTEIGKEQNGPNGDNSMFALKSLDKSEVINKIAKGKMAVITEKDARADHDSGLGSSAETDEEEDEEEDRLDREMDAMYEQYQERKSAVDAKYRAKKARKEHEDGEWEGFSGDEQQSEDSEDMVEESSDDEDEDEEDSSSKKALLTDLDGSKKTTNGLSKRASQFFDQDLFKDIGALDEEDAESGEEDEEALDVDLDELDMIREKQKAKEQKAKPTVESKKGRGKAKIEEDADEDDNDGFEIVKKSNANDWEDDEPRKNGRLDIDIITAEAMTLAQQLASGEKSSKDLIDEGFNRYAFKDRDGLPDWFLDDESKHDKPHRPITAAAAAAIKEKLRALNARPIKKVREAKDRKKFKAAQRLEKLRKKSALIADEEGMTEKEKATTIAKLMSKAAKKKPKQQVKVVVARGSNKGISGRPRGVKGRYKIVDARMKKDLRAEKRLAKKKK
ncbi:hypothetical protein DH86_00001138 [Scytalidium sp. 3C]|nr:hypothetical protein DH86_00001138 [Scytalidium sp. 3C]